MVKISAIARIAVEQLKGIEDTTKNFLVLPQNQLNTQVTNAINNGQLGINENTTSKIDRQRLTHGVMSVVKNATGTKNVGVVPINSDGDTVASLVLTPQSSVDRIGLTVKFTGGSGTANVTYILIAG